MSTRLEQNSGKAKGSNKALIAAVVVVGLVAGGWWYGHKGQSPTPPAQVTASQASPVGKEVPGATRMIDVAAQLKADQYAPVGTEARKIYEAAIARINQVKATIDKALTQGLDPFAFHNIE
jgi:cytoskeletal protein RodZ